MTTEIFQFAQNINEENELYVLEKKTKCFLSGAAYVWNQWENKLETTEKSIEILRRKLQYAFPSFNHWLFVGHRNWQPDNRIVRHRKLWSALSSKGISIPDGEKIDEVLVSGQEGIKYFGLIRCNTVVDDSLASILRSGLEAQLIFAEESTAMMVSKFLLSDGWEHEGNAPSDKVIDLLCDADMFAYLPLGWFDDRESGCAVIAKEHLIISSFSEGIK